MPTLTLTADTWAKQRPVQSSTLSDAEKAWVRAGEYPCLAYADAPGDHALVTLDPAKIDLKGLHPSGRNTWNFYNGHCEIEGNIPGNQPKDAAPATAPPRGRIVTIPGIGAIGVNERIPGCQNFTISEATHGGNRIPESAEITRGLITIGKALDEVRAMLGNQPLSINSWHRPPAINKAVGGASQSSHLRGHAVDFQHPHMKPQAIYNRLDGWWGSRGGLAWCDRPGRRFVHIDARGFKSRWLY